MRRPAALLAALAAIAVARAAAAELPAFDERFRGIPVDRCKELGGPPTWAKDGPRIVSLSAPGGKKNDLVVIAGENVDAREAVEVHFLWKGSDVTVPAELAGGTEFRVRVPGIRGLKGRQSGWIYLSRGSVRGKARPFQFLPDAADAPGATGPAVGPPPR